MKTTLTSLAFFVLFSVISISSQGQEAPTISPSYFAKSLVSDILKQKDCTGIRVYPAKDVKTNKLTMMIIGIKADGSEIYNGLWSKTKYQLFEGVTNGQVSCEPLNSKNAKIACSGYSGNNPKFSADFKASDIDKFWGENGCTGMKLSTLFANSLNNFSAVASKLDGNSFPDLGSPVAGDPCPTFCGNMSNYLCPAQ